MLSRERARTSLTRLLRLYAPSLLLSATLGFLLHTYLGLALSWVVTSSVVTLAYLLFVYERLSRTALRNVAPLITLGVALFTTALVFVPRPEPATNQATAEALDQLLAPHVDSFPSDPGLREPREALVKLRRRCASADSSVHDLREEVGDLSQKIHVEVDRLNREHQRVRRGLLAASGALGGAGESDALKEALRRIVRQPEASAFSHFDEVWRDVSLEASENPNSTLSNRLQAAARAASNSGDQATAEAFELTANTWRADPQSPVDHARKTMQQLTALLALERALFEVERRLGELLR